MPKLPISKTVWGLDVSASAIKGVRLRVEGERVELLDADIIPFEGPNTSPDTPGRDKRIWQALQRFEADYRLSRGRVSVGLPGSIFFMRPFNVFMLPDRAESELVRFELEQHIPFGLDAVLWDYEIFSPEDVTSNERQGILFALKKDVLNNYLLSLSAAKIEPMQIQAAPLGLYNFIQYELQPDAPMLVLDLGAGNTTLLAISGQRYWLRTLNMGGDALNAAIQNVFRAHNISLEEAEEIKLAMPTLARRGELAQLLMPAMRGFIGEIRNAIQVMGQEHKLKFDRMLVVGGGSATYGLPRLLSDELKLRTVTPAGLGRIELAESVDTAFVHENLPQLAGAIGLALQALGQSATRVNMVGATLTQRRSQTMLRRTAAIGAAALLAIVVCLGAFNTWRKAALSNAKDKMQADALGAIEFRRGEAAKLNRPGESQVWLDEIRNMASERAVALQVLDKIARVLPPENSSPATPASKKMWLISLSLRPKAKAKGIYEATLEAGTGYQQNEGHLSFARSALIAPLENDPSGMFKNVSDFTFAGPSPALAFGSTEPKRYYVVRMTFDVVPKAAQ